MLANKKDFKELLNTLLTKPSKELANKEEVPNRQSTKLPEKLKKRSTNYPQDNSHSERKIIFLKETNFQQEELLLRLKPSLKPRSLI